jgi:crotonobetainyl-CoA:carnitine CoA-transferase CaiB-like acyl-CoA transferase
MSEPPRRGPLAGLRVIDMATVVAGPGAARHLADFGATVVKVEPPRGDSTRAMGWRVAGDDSLMWKHVNRGKYCVTIDLKDPDGLARFRRLADDADVLIENMRPGKLEALGLGPDELLERNPRLVILRVSGFGQDGPYAQRPGFATAAEALSGMASLMGEPGHGPSLPPFALSDEVAGLIGAFATVMAVRAAERDGQGQVIDVSLLESALQLLGPLPGAWSELGYIQPQLGSGLPFSVPRGVYRTRDGEWLALSTSSESVAGRVVGLLGAEGDERFRDFPSRIENRDALESLMRAWVGERDSAEVIASFLAADASISPVNDMSQVVEDPQIVARAALVDVDGILMQNVAARMSRTPGDIAFSGAELGEHDELFSDGWPAD